MVDYDKIDKKCIPLVKFFNENGLETKYSCEGHDRSFMNSFYIMFSDNIDDTDIADFIDKFSNKYQHSPFMGKFLKWCRKMNGRISYNWVYEVSYGDYKNNQNFADIDLKTMQNQLNTKGKVK